MGGAVVSIYTEGLYQSGDLDFVIQNIVKDRLPSVMKEIGFGKEGRHYVHPECKHLFVEFPAGPLGIGEETDINPKNIESNGSTIKILNPTDCIKDRLASYIYFESREGMEQAILVARSQPFKKSSVKRWCEGEGYGHIYREFCKYLRGSY